MQDQKKEDLQNSNCEEQLFIRKLGIEEEYKIEFCKDDKCHNLILSNKLRKLKPTCKICSKTFIGKDKIYFCEEERSFFCRYCIINKHKVNMVREGNEVLHEDKNINIYFSD